MSNVIIDIKNRERIIINPNDGTRLTKLTRGIQPTESDVETVGSEAGKTEGDGRGKQE